jgi:hypothetical protein
MALKTYTVTIEYDPDKEEVEYIQEYVDEDEFECLVEFESSGCVDMSEYWDDETMKLIDKIYDVGVS